MIAPRTLFVSHSGVLGGAERSLLDLAGGWPVERRVLVLAEGSFPVELRERGVPTDVESLGALGKVRRESGTPGLGALADVARLASKVAKVARTMDVIHANSQKAFVVAAAAGLLARRPVVWHLRDILTTAHFSASNIRAAVFLANARAAAVIANSEATAAAFRDAGGKADLVQVVYNGLDAERFTGVGDEEAAQARATLARPGSQVLAVCARLAPWKGQHVAIAALPALPSAEVWIIGKALFGEDVYADSLRAQAESLGVSERVRFLGEREDVPTLLRAADIVLHTAVHPEPFGRVVVEGMLARRPVIATDAGGVREILRHRETGWLVPPGDPEALAAAVNDVFSLGAADANALVTRAFDTATSRFSTAAMVEQVAAVLAAAVSDRRPRG